jgi:long-subunit acyl-CoA synthetase (AMP-forming)
MPGAEVKIAANGEILVKGPSVMQGYHHEPDGDRSLVVEGFATGDRKAVEQRYADRLDSMNNRD